MKKYIALLLLIMVAMISTAQTRMTEQAKDGTLEAGSWSYIWGTSADTLTNADTLTYVMRIRGEQTFDVKAQVYNNHVSGTAAFKLYTYNSIDGLNWTAATADSLTITGVTADALFGTALSFTDVMDVYKKFVYIQSGTAVSIPKLEFITRKN